jgi:hypothetical protein
LAAPRLPGAQLTRCVWGAQIGLTVNSTSEQVGAFALAYAVHKAASPIRFPPTVALTPLVAKWMGKEIKA